MLAARRAIVGLLYCIVVAALTANIAGCGPAQSPSETTLGQDETVSSLPSLDNPETKMEPGRTEQTPASSPGEPEAMPDGSPLPTEDIVPRPPGRVEATLLGRVQVLTSWEEVPGAEYYTVTLYFGDDRPAAHEMYAVPGPRPTVSPDTLGPYASQRVGKRTLKTRWLYGLGPWAADNLSGACVRAIFLGAGPTGRESECAYVEVIHKPAEEPLPPLKAAAPDWARAKVDVDGNRVEIAWAEASLEDTYWIKLFFHDKDGPVIMGAGPGGHAVYRPAPREAVNLNRLVRVCVAAGTGTEVSKCTQAVITTP